MTNRFKLYLTHQLVWTIVAIAINLYSYYGTTQGRPTLTPTDPLAGIVLFLIYSPVLLIGFMGKRKTYVVLTTAFVILVFLGGVLKHLTAFSSPEGLSAYASTFWWIIAILVNVYGVTVSTLAMLSLRQGVTNEP